MSHPPLRFNALSKDIARVRWGCDCGASTLAAVLGITLDAARQLFADNGVQPRRVPIAAMVSILNAGRHSCRRIEVLPSYGMAVIEHNAARYHYIGVSGEKIFDVKAMLVWKDGWHPFHIWRREILPRYASFYRVHCGLEVER